MSDESPVKASIAGGSIGGLCAGIALRGIGADVQIFERESGPMDMLAPQDGHEPARLGVRLRVTEQILSYLAGSRAGTGECKCMTSPQSR